MKSTPEVTAALNACLQYERTLKGCAAAYYAYWKRWEFWRLKRWFRKEAAFALRRIERLVDRLERLDTIPGNDIYPFDVEVVDTAADIIEVFDYFVRMLGEARDAYDFAHAACDEAGDRVSCKILGNNKALSRANAGGGRGQAEQDQAHRARALLGPPHTPRGLDHGPGSQSGGPGRQRGTVTR